MVVFKNISMKSDVKMPIRFLILLQLNFFALSACIEPFSPEQRGYEDLLTVEGLLTDQDEPTIIKISRSIPIDTSFQKSFSQVTSVRIIENDDAVHTLQKINDFEYRTDPSVFRGTIGASYVLHIQTSEQRNYYSEPVVLRPTPPIEKVYFRYREQFVQGLDQPASGIEILLDTKDPNNNTNYYRWQYDETWIINSTFFSGLEFRDDTVVQREEPISICYPTARSSNIIIGTSVNLSADVIVAKGIKYVSNQSKRLYRTYSINVKQYALSKESYEYHRQLLATTENLGTLFDPQPYELVGNIYCEEDPDERVLGYFDASAAQEKRLFVERQELPFFPVPGPTFCLADTVSFEEIPMQLNTGKLLIQEVMVGFTAEFIEYMVAPRFCSDCRNEGTNIKPDFWP